jgi:hypothetical protein
VQLVGYAGITQTGMPSFGRCRWREVRPGITLEDFFLETFPKLSLHSVGFTVNGLPANTDHRLQNRDVVNMYMREGPTTEEHQVLVAFRKLRRETRTLLSRKGFREGLMRAREDGSLLRDMAEGRIPLKMDRFLGSLGTMLDLAAGEKALLLLAPEKRRSR